MGLSFCCHVYAPFSCSFPYVLELCELGLGMAQEIPAAIKRRGDWRFERLLWLRRKKMYQHFWEVFQMGQKLPRVSICPITKQISGWKAWGWKKRGDVLSYNCWCFYKKFVAKSLGSMPGLFSKEDARKKGGDLRHRILQKVHNFDYGMPALKSYLEQYFVLDNEVCQSF